MKSLWKKSSELSRYYIISGLTLMVSWGILALLDVEFINTIFFLTAFIWHFALIAPGLKEKVLTGRNRFSFLSVAVRFNHYLQIFISLKKVPHAPSFIRALSPLLFTVSLLVVGGSGNVLFTLLGSLVFEAVYLFVKNKTSLLGHRDDPDTPPAFPNAGIPRE